MNLPNQTNKVAEKTLFWFRIYSLFLAVIYLLCVIGGILMAGIGAYHLSNGIRLKDDTEVVMVISGVIMLVLGFILMIPFAAAPFLPRRPWVWTLGIVLIGIGMTSACFLPVCIPLLIYWLKPETKAVFGR